MHCLFIKTLSSPASSNVDNLLKIAFVFVSLLKFDITPRKESSPARRAFAPTSAMRSAVRSESSCKHTLKYQMNSPMQMMRPSKANLFSKAACAGSSPGSVVSVHEQEN